MLLVPEAVINTPPGGRPVYVIALRGIGGGERSPASSAISGQNPITVVDCIK